MSHHPARRINENLFFIAAWNEWNEQGAPWPQHCSLFRVFFVLFWVLGVGLGV